MDDDLAYTSAVELLRRVESKAISPVEVVQATLDRVEALNPRLNALCTLTAERAMDRAHTAQTALVRGERLGPLHGIPVTIKDLAFTRGVKTMGGSHIFADRVPDEDAPFVTRLEQAGAIMIGKTTTPEFGWKGCGDSPLTGVSHNPWKHGYNAGGSSTGAAICAASGIGPIHQGSDGAGSIRMPASFCGVYGVKPSYGRVPYYPMSNNDHLSHIGPITRTVADAALMLRVMAGPDDRDQGSLEAPPRDYLAHLDDGIAGLRIAFSPDLGYLPVDREVTDVVAAAVRAFEGLGYPVEEVDPGWGDHTEMEHCIWTTMIAGNAGPYVARWREHMDPGLVACIEEGHRYSAVDFFAFRAERNACYQQVRKFFERYDLLLTPTLSVAAFPAGRLIPEHWEQHRWDWIRWAGFSYPFNLTWMPAASCPCGFTEDGRPVGLQIVAGRFQDLRVLQASRVFEQAFPWRSHRPLREP